MSNMYGKDKFHDRQKAVLQKSAQKIENDSGWSQDNFLRGYAEEILPASGAELSFGELCAIGEQVEQEAAFSAKEAMRNKIKARRDAERYKSTGTDSEQRTPNPFEDSSAIATESPKNEDTLNTMRKHADAQPTKSAGIKTSKKQSLVETTRELKKYIHIISCGGVLYYHNEYYYTQLDSKQLIKLYRQNVDYELNNESSLRGYKDLYDCLVTDPQIECSEPEDEPIYAPLENGILDLMEWKLYPHSPDQITFTCIKAKYDPQAKCQIFEEYLQRVTGGDSLLSERVWMAIGYLLIYPARGKFFIFMKGIGNSGKSVLGSFIRRLYPKESISSIRLKQMKNEFGMSSLANAVINFDMDMPSSKIDEEAASRLKQITGGDSINVPRKFRDDALLERRIKFVFSSNHPIIIDGEDDALLKRIIYLPFNYAIPDDQQDPDLGDKIWKERDAIATKALRYARKLVKLNYIFPEIPQMDNAKCIVRDSIAKTVGKFVQESCDKSESKAVTATEDLYYKLNAEGGVEKWIPYEYNLYRNILVTSSSFDKAFNDTYKGFIKPQSEYPDAYTDTFYISQKLSNSTGNSILDVLNDAFSDGSSEWVGYKGGFFSYNDDACVLVTAKGMSFSESGDYSLTYVESGKTTTLTDSRGFEQEADIYYAYNTDEFSEAYENLNTVDNEIADESNLIFEFLIGNENYTDWQ